MSAEGYNSVDLLFHRAEPCFYAFDLLMCNGRDLRAEELTDRKREHRRLLGFPRHPDCSMPTT